MEFVQNVRCLTQLNVTQADKRLKRKTALLIYAMIVIKTSQIGQKQQIAITTTAAATQHQTTAKGEQNKKKKTNKQQQHTGN